MVAAYSLRLSVLATGAWDQGWREGQKQDFGGGQEPSSASCGQGIPQLAGKFSREGGLGGNCEQMRPYAVPRVANSGAVAV